MVIVMGVMGLTQAINAEETYYHYDRSLKSQGYTKIDRYGTQRHYSKNGTFQGMSKPRFPVKNSVPIQKGKK